MQKMVARPADGAVGDDDAAEEPSRSGTPVSPPPSPPPPALTPVHAHACKNNLTRDRQVPDDDDLDDPRNRRKRVAAAAAAQVEEEKRRMEEWVLFYVCVCLSFACVVFFGCWFVTY
jgi:hypothetical protein